MDPYTVALDFERGRWISRLAAEPSVRAEALWLIQDTSTWFREVLAGWSADGWEDQADRTVARQVAEELLGLPRLTLERGQRLVHPCCLFVEDLRVLRDPVTGRRVPPTDRLIEWAVAKHAAPSKCLVRPSFHLVASLRGIGARRPLLARLEYRQGSCAGGCFRVIETDGERHWAMVSTPGVLQCVA